MGAAKKSFRDFVAERAQKREVQPDDVADTFGMVLAFVEDCVAEHPTDPPPVVTLGRYQDACYVTVSDKAYRRSISGFGDNYREALNKLNSILAKPELPWKSWA